MTSDGKVTISTLLDNAGLKKGINSISGSFGGLKSVVSKLAAAIGLAFSAAAVVNFGKEASKAAMQLSDALTGLQSILEGQGRSFSSAQAFIEEYTKDGLIPATNAITAYKNLAMRGYDDSQIRQVMVALKDASAYGRQASYTMGEAVESASEGLKNENSILVDNAGVTKNVAKMWEEYAASIGTTASNLTQQQKIQAEVTGILEESKYQTGDAAKVAGTLSGQLQQLSFNFNNLKIAVGNAINPVVQHFLPAINSAITAVTRFANTLAAAMSIIFGKVSVQTESIAESAAAGAEAEEALAKSIGGAGKAAKKSLAGFDELNTLQSNAAGGGSGGGGSGSGSSSATAINGASELGDGVITKEAEKVAEIIRGIASYVPIIAAALGGLKLGSFLSDLLTANIEAKTLKERIGLLAKKAGLTVGITLAITGIALETKGIVGAIKEGLNGTNFAEIIGGGGMLASGGALIGQFFGSAILGGAIGGIVAGVPAFIAGIYDAIVGGIDWLNAALVGVGATAAGAGIGAIIGMLGGPIGAGIGALIGLAAGLVSDLVILIVQNWESISAWFANVCATIGKWFEDLWQDIVSVWGVCSKWFNTTVIKPVRGFFSDLWKDISSLASECWEAVVEFFSPAIEWFSELFNSVYQTLSDIFYNIGVIAEGCWEIIKAVWAVVSTWFNTNIIQPVSTFFSNMWTGIKTWAIEAWEGIKSVFSTIGSWINANIIQPVGNFFSGLWSGFLEKAKAAWEGVKTVFGNTASFFSDTFQKAWAGIVKVFSVAGEIFVDIKDGILTAFKSVVNGIIRGLNSVISVPFNGINTAIRRIRNVSVLGLYPFSGLSTVSVPSIPYLAQGAVLPANKPFMAVVGDQHHGTNVEAPLTTIQEAVANVMGDQISAMMAGFEALLAENQMLRQVVENIDLGDTTIGQAANRYQQKVAIMRGG